MEKLPFIKQTIILQLGFAVSFELQERMHCVVVVLLLCTLLVHTALGRSGGAAGCAGGQPAVSGSHLSALSVVKGSLAEGLRALRIDGLEVDANKIQILKPQTKHVIEIVSTNASPFRGVLIRVANRNSNDAFLLENGDSDDVKVAPVCAAPVQGLTHTSSAPKVRFSGTFTTATSDFTVFSVDVTVVDWNNDEEGSQYWHTTYTFSNGEEVNDVPKNSPSRSPTATPVRTPIQTMVPTKSKQTTSPTKILQTMVPTKSKQTTSPTKIPSAPLPRPTCGSSPSVPVACKPPYTSTVSPTKAPVPFPVPTCGSSPSVPVACRSPDTPTVSPTKAPEPFPVPTCGSSPSVPVACKPPATTTAQPSGCFSKDAQVHVHGKGITNMDKLQIGDLVMTGNGSYSKVYSFGHYSTKIWMEFLQFHTNTMDSPLEISAEHLLFVNGKLAPAIDVKVGDTLTTLISSDVAMTVQSVKKVWRQGAYAPLTITGDLIVNGVVASNYVSRDWLKDSVSGYLLHALQHGSLQPYRFYCTWVDCSSEVYDENTGFNPWVSFWFSVEQWQLGLNPFLQSLLLMMVVIPLAGCVIAVSQLLLLVSSSSMFAYLAAVLMGYFYVGRLTYHKATINR